MLFSKAFCIHGDGREVTPQYKSMKAMSSGRIQKLQQRKVSNQVQMSPSQAKNTCRNNDPKLFARMQEDGLIPVTSNFQTLPFQANKAENAVRT
jgi:hypothetical protein